MWKAMYQLLRNGYFCLYLGVDSVVCTPLTVAAPALERVLPLDEFKSGYFSYQATNIKSAVMYGRNRYSIHDVNSDRVTFKFSGLSGVRQAGVADSLTKFLHGNLANTIQTQTKLLHIPQSGIRVDPKFQSFQLVDQIGDLRHFHILEHKRIFPHDLILKRGSIFVKWEDGDDMEIENSESPLNPYIPSLPYGWKLPLVSNLDQFLSLISQLQYNIR